MLMRNRGGEVARCAPLLALVPTSFLMGLCGGCRAPSVMLTGRQTVQTDALLTLHPAWAQVEALDKISVQFAAQPRPSGIATPDLPSLPAAFTPPKDAPGVAPAQRLQRAEASSDQYLQQLAETLRLQDEAYLARRARRQAQEVQATYAKELAAREAAIWAERLKQASDLERQITRLQFRDVAFQTQLIYKGQARLDAQLQHDALLAQIKALTQQADALMLPSSITDVAVADVKPRLEELRRLAEQDQAKERANRATQRAAQIQQEKGKLAFDADPLPPINETPLPAPDSRETPLVLPPGAAAGATFQTANGGVGAKLALQKAAWQAQRERLVTIIRADTQQAFTQIAKQKGWNLAPPGTSGAQDETEAVKPLLRAQWMQGRAE